MIVLLYLFRLLTADPVTANGIVAGGDIRTRITLDRIVLRESRGRALGVHQRDAHHSRTAWRNAVIAGYLDPANCPFHRLSWDPDGQATRGSAGLMWAYNGRFLGDGDRAPCVPPSILDIPLFSAWAARRKAEHACERMGACTYRERASVWRNGRPPETDQ